MENTHRTTIAILFVAIVFWLSVTSAGSAIELYNSTPSVFGLTTRLFGTDFQAAPFETFDFGTGPVNTFNTNFMLQSTGPEDVGAVALSLTDGAGLFVTLQSERVLNSADPPPGPASVGIRPIFNTAWDMQIDFFVDYRQGSRNGRILPPFLLPPEIETQFTMVSMSNRVLDTPPPGAVMIPGITSDFWVSDFGMVRINEGSPDFDTVMVFSHATVPEPTAFVLNIVALLVVPAWNRRTRAKTASHVPSPIFSAVPPP